MEMPVFTRDSQIYINTVQRIHRLSQDLRLIDELKAPRLTDYVNAPILEDWTIHYRMEPALVGMVTGHPSQPNGPTVTSGLFFLDETIGVARTLSRWYRLGKPIR